MSPTFRPSPVRTARLTGAAYLALAVTGMLGFLLIRPQIVGETGAQTLANISQHQGLAHALVALELGIVLTQAVTAMGFLALWRPSAPVAGAAIAGFGLVNSAAILGSATALATAITVAGDAGLAPGGDQAATVQLLTQVSAHAWTAGAVFFGLWLIPMGWAAVSTRRQSRIMGWVLIVGGVGYVGSAPAGLGWADAPGWVTETLTFPATVGELWVMGYLMSVGIRGDGGRVPARQ